MRQSQRESVCQRKMIQRKGAAGSGPQGSPAGRDRRRTRWKKQPHLVPWFGYPNQPPFPHPTQLPSPVHTCRGTPPPGRHLSSVRQARAGPPASVPERWGQQGYYVSCEGHRATGDGLLNLRLRVYLLLSFFSFFLLRATGKQAKRATEEGLMDTGSGSTESSHFRARPRHSVLP